MCQRTETIHSPNVKILLPFNGPLGQKCVTEIKLAMGGLYYSKIPNCFQHACLLLFSKIFRKRMFVTKRMH